MIISKFRLELTDESGDDLPIYVSGNFNSWTTDDEQFRLRKDDRGVYYLNFPAFIKLPAPFEYKYVKGTWKGVELDEYGNLVPNRVLEKPEGIIQDIVSRWSNEKDDFEQKLLPKKIVVDDDFYIPQLDRERRVWALLPHDYHTSNKRYPVLYLQDGQNLFDKNAPFGNWAIDEKLAMLAEEDKSDLIIIAIEHAYGDRIKEYSPSKSKKGPGEGKGYLLFVTQTLKPFIDRNYRTLTDRANTGIGGSSMGGLISIYAGFAFAEYFGRLMIFSPSLWLLPNIHFELIKFQNALPTKIYVYGGDKEGANMVPNINKLKKTIEQKGLNSSLIEFEVSINPQGKHSENEWGDEFPRAVEWLFFESTD